MKTLENVQVKTREGINCSSTTVKAILGTITLIVVGVLLPEFFHMIGGSGMGMKFLPMHIPVLIAGLLFGSISGVCTASGALFLNFFLTGMPTAEKLPFMFVELVTYGVVCGFLHKKKCNIYVSVIGGLVAGRLANAVALVVASNLIGLQVSGVASVWQSLLTGIPGIITQLIAIPVIVILVKKVAHLDKRNAEG